MCQVGQGRRPRRSEAKEGLALPLFCQAEYLQDPVEIVIGVEVDLHCAFAFLAVRKGFA